MNVLFRGLFLALFFVLTAYSLPVSAQDSAGISIIPANLDEKADPGQRLERSIKVTNLSQVEQTYYIYTRDIVGVRDGNVPEFADDGREMTGLEMSMWIELPSEPYVVAPGQSVNVPVIINVPGNASPGSHFAAIFASVEAPRLREIGAGVGYEVASIVTMKVSGDAIIDAQIREFSTEKIIHGSTNVDFNVRLQNTGTVLVRPYGPLQVSNMFGKMVYETTFNDSLGGVFPGTVRDFVVNWNDETPGFGRYEATIALIYEAEAGNKTIDAVVTFWILPAKIVAIVAVVLAVAAVTLYFGVKLYIRRAVREVSSSRRLVRRPRQSKQVSLIMLISIVLLTVTALFLVVLLFLSA